MRAAASAELTHWSLLLQIPITSYIQGRHSSALKCKEGKGISQRLRLVGIENCSRLINKEYDQRAEHADTKFRS